MKKTGKDRRRNEEEPIQRGANSPGGEANGSSQSAIEVGRELEVSAAILYNWKAKYGGLDIDEAKRLNALADENSRLKRLVADMSLDREALKWLIKKTDGASN